MFDFHQSFDGSGGMPTVATDCGENVEYVVSFYADKDLTRVAGMVAIGDESVRYSMALMNMKYGVSVVVYDETDYGDPDW